MLHLEAIYLWFDYPSLNSSDFSDEIIDQSHEKTQVKKENFLFTECKSCTTLVIVGDFMCERDD